MAQPDSVQPEGDQMQTPSSNDGRSTQQQPQNNQAMSNASMQQQAQSLNDAQNNPDPQNSTESYYVWEMSTAVNQLRPTHPSATEYELKLLAVQQLQEQVASYVARQAAAAAAVTSDE